jgi:fatty acid-binding protein DegV
VTLGLCIDSNGQLPHELVERYGVTVVPLTVTIDDEDHLEGVDLDADAFYAHFAHGRRPDVRSSPPSPGQFAVAYDEMVAAGCTHVLGIHVSAAVSGTLNAARLAARELPVPVRLVDSGTTGFGVSCCLWAAAEALAAGAGVEEAAAVAESMSPRVGNVFVVGGDDDGVPILSLVDGEVRVLRRVASMVDAVDSMAELAVRWGEQVRVGVGLADRASAAVAEALAAAVGEAASVVEVVRYRVGPSVGGHTGPGTVGLYVLPA